MLSAGELENQGLHLLKMSKSQKLQLRKKLIEPVIQDLFVSLLGDMRRLDEFPRFERGRAADDSGD